MKIAIGTKDKLNIFFENFQGSPFFAIIDLLSAKPFTEEIRQNPFGDETEKALKTKITNLLSDRTTRIGNRFDDVILRELTEAKLETSLITLETVD